MSTLFDYIAWRGDIPFHRVGLTPVDSLIFSAIVYADFSGIVGSRPAEAVSLEEAATALLALPDAAKRVRSKQDLALLKALAQSPRFRNVGLTFFRSILLPQEQTQFAAITFLPDDGSAFLCFRGTDFSLVGWKEDFNMSFQDSVPAQREAVAYALEYAFGSSQPLYLGGHSKGGNLAVYAAAKLPAVYQNRIVSVFNNDGPGFTESLMGDPGYLAIVPRTQTYIPESSIIGMLLEHKEPYRAIRSRQVSLLQHELYSWEVLGGEFLPAEGLSRNVTIMDRAITDWIKSMSREEREKFIDSVYALLSSGGASTVIDLIHPKNVWTLFRTLNTDEPMRKLLSEELSQFVRLVVKAAKNV